MSRVLAVLLVLLPAVVGAQGLPWDGTYRLGPGGDCSRVGEAGGALRIGEGVLTGVGSACAMTLPVDVLDMEATLYTMECEAEGSPDAEPWTARAMLMDAAEGDAIYIVWDGHAFRHERCPAPLDAAGAGPR